MMINICCLVPTTVQAFMSKIWITPFKFTQYINLLLLLHPLFFLKQQTCRVVPLSLVSFVILEFIARGILQYKTVGPPYYYSTVFILSGFSDKGHYFRKLSTVILYRICMPIAGSLRLGEFKIIKIIPYLLGYNDLCFFNIQLINLIPNQKYSPSY